MAFEVDRDRHHFVLGPVHPRVLLSDRLPFEKLGALGGGDFVSVICLACLLDVVLGYYEGVLFFDVRGGMGGCC